MENNWIRLCDRLPSSGERCLITDGDVVVIATHIPQGDDKYVWIISELEITKSETDKTFDVQGWMPLPKPIKKIVAYEEAIISSVKPKLE